MGVWNLEFVTEQENIMTDSEREVESAVMRIEGK